MKKSLIFLFSALALVACKRIPLYDPQSDVFLKVNYIIPEVNLNDDIDIENDPYIHEKVFGRLPEEIRVCFYDPLTHALVAEDFLPAQGGFVNIPAGTYDMIVYGLGTEATIVKDTDTRAMAYAYTSFTGTKVRVVGNETRSAEEFNIIFEPDHLFEASAEGIVIPVHSEIDKPVVIEVDATTLLESYSFEVLNIQGAGRIRKADIYITGQAPGKYLWDRRLPNKPGAIWFQAEVNVEKGHIYTVFNTFGKYPGERNDVFLNVLVTDAQGDRYQWVYDVTDQFDNPDNTHHEIIIDDPIVIPEGGGGGFNHEVQAWEEEVIYIPL